jgi:diguanylate cyclase (GGDEF)-like protein/PAS domain S-box-containing protein
MGTAQPSPALPDRTQRVRALSALFLGGSTLALVSTVVLPLPAGVNVAGTLVLVAIAGVIGALLLAAAPWVPEWLPPIAVAIGTVIVSADVYFAGPTGVANEMFYLFVGIYSFYFLPTVIALVEIAFVGGAYALALAAGTGRAPEGRWLVTMGVLLVTGILIARIVGQLKRWVVHSTAREEELREAEERFRSSFENAAIGMALVGLDGRWLRVNDALVQLTGYDAEQLVEMSFRDLTPHEDLEADVNAFDDLISGRTDSHHAEKRYIRADGQLVWVALSVSVVRDRDGHLLHLISQMQDITARKAAEHELAERALHDPLTGLPNRILFTDRVQVALAHVERSHEPVSVFFIDLDRFKLVNDSLGHAVGDRMLVEIAERLQRVVRPGDTISRFGGDEFTVLCENTDERAAAVIGERILGTLATPLNIDGHELFADASIGISVTRDHRLPAEAMLRDSDVAMYRAKDQGGARVALFDGRMHLRATERLELENDLRRGLERGELRLLFQPDVDLRDGHVHGVEALVRWQHPRRGLVAPTTFIRMAEESGLIVPLGEWVIQEAAAQARLWQDAGLGLTISINISPRQLADPALPDVVVGAIERAAADPMGLCLEITETAAVDAGDPTLSALKASGVKLALDDFGAGFSSLHQIRRLPPVDTLKIDRSFVEEIGRRPADAAIVAAIVGMARALEMVTVAEGIQNERQVRILRELGVDRGQGYHFGRPVGPGAIEELVRSGACGELVGS